MLSGVFSVLLADDHALVRGALSERLERETGITIAGVASTADEAIELIPETKPDIVLMDIDMPGMICFDAARMIITMRPDTHIVFLSAFVSDLYVEQALAVRASGYLVKREPLDAVVEALRIVAAGGAYFSEEVLARIAVDSRSAKLANCWHSRASTLTPRESEVLRYIARGLTKKEIANTMHISVKTVDQHALKLMKKLDIHDRVELARFAIREGMVEV